MSGVSIFQIAVAVLLIGAILLQNQKGGLSASFAGAGEFYRSRRSLEKMLFVATIALATVFGIFSILLLLPR